MRKIYRYFIIRYKNRALKNKLNCFLGYLLLWIPLIAFAGIEQHGKIWLGLDKSGLLLSDSDWLYTLSTQMRGITSSAVLQTFFSMAVWDIHFSPILVYGLAIGAAVWQLSWKGFL